MARHRLLIVGAGRIGAGLAWHDDSYTHAGAAKALRERVELVGFVEPDLERAAAAKAKWLVPAYEDVLTGVAALRPDIVSVCVQPEQQESVLEDLPRELKGVYCEKPFASPKLVWPWPIQVNYLRRGDPRHQAIAEDAGRDRKLIVYAKDDIHTKCHFEDLAKWWQCPLDYRVYNGPCAYALKYPHAHEDEFFDNGGVDGGDCMKRMLGNLINVIDGIEHFLWSPPHAS